MKIVSWNLNSIRARQERLLAYLAAAKPDVLCLQELKCTEDDFPAAEIEAAGYRWVANFQKTYNGVAILSPEQPKNVLVGMSDDVEDPQSRVIAATVNGVRIICVYAPNGQEVGSEAYGYKLKWYDRLRAYLDGREKKSDKLVLTGDFNVAPHDIDVHDPKAWEGQTLFSLPEREKLKLVSDFGLVDTFRAKNPDEQKFSWWDYRMLSFPKNKGLRIDHVLATEKLAKSCTAAGIDREQRKGKQPSDHAPVWADFDV